eukprot:4274103-Pyramimonas_sp.AAC.2
MPLMMGNMKAAVLPEPVCAQSCENTAPHRTHPDSQVSQSQARSLVTSHEPCGEESLWCRSARSKRA